MEAVTTAPAATPGARTPGAYGLASVLVLVFGVSSSVLLAAFLARDPSGPSDYFGLWSWSRFVATEGTAALYDPAALHRFQRALDPAYAEIWYPFLYPPTYLLFIWPLGLIDETTSRIAWTVASVAVFLCGTLGWRGRGLAPLALVAPSTILTLICGQNGLLTAGLLIGALRLAGTRPIRAGLLLGLLSYKPQFAVLVPVAFVAAGHWRALLAALGTAAVLAGMASLVFGMSLWPAWWAARADHWSTIEAFIASHDHLVPTVSAFLHALHAGPGLTHVVQTATGLLAVCSVWSMWRRAPGTARAIAIVPIATLLTTPYAFLYDLPILTGGLLVAWAALIRGTSVDRVALVAGLALPLLMFAVAGGVPSATPIVAGLLWTLGRRSLRSASLQPASYASL